MLDLFLLMSAYYIIKPVRESLILGGAGPEIKSYAGAAEALSFLMLVPLYGKLASCLNRIRSSTHNFCMSSAMAASA